MLEAAQGRIQQSRREVTGLAEDRHGGGHVREVARAWRQHQPDLRTPVLEGMAYGGALVTLPSDAAPPIGDYGFISDGHMAALVSKSGSVDWACLPRLDSPSVFGRILDWERGGHCSIAAPSAVATTRRYVRGTLVLETTYTTRSGRAVLRDLVPMRPGGARNPLRTILRIIEGLDGSVDLDVEISPRFGYGAVKPWLRCLPGESWGCIGAEVGLLIRSDMSLTRRARHDLVGSFRVEAGEQRYLSLEYRPPEDLDRQVPEGAAANVVLARLDETVTWWHRWRTARTDREPDDVVLSAIVLKGLTNPPTGAIAAAATTSLPEAAGGARNWDYRFSWIRDSWLTVRALHQLGFAAEADGFARFVERSAAGSGSDLQVMYGLGGERDLVERELGHLGGYRGARPVRMGNDAFRQHQHDVFGELIDVMWMSRHAKPSVDDDFWQFVVETVDRAAAEWTMPDRGIWEMRGEPRHFTFSKAMCWMALDRGLGLARHYQRDGPLDRWAEVADEVRSTTLRLGFDDGVGAFTQAFGTTDLDASVLLLPATGIIAADDQRMRSTVDAAMAGLDRGGLLARYSNADGLDGLEGVFLPSTCWLIECLAAQGRGALARRYLARLEAISNDLGLFSEEFDPRDGELMGNFPQALTHIGHILASLAVEDLDRGSTRR